VPDKRYLITPGPTPVPPEVTAAIGLPLHHHRSPDFKELLGRALAGLRQVFRTDGDVLLLTGSGTAAMESAVANLLSPGERALVASAGNFGERWAKLAAAYGIEVVHVERAWGERIDPDEIAAALASAGDVGAVFVTHCETSTGVVHDVEAIAAAVRASRAPLVVDAVSSLGGVPLEMDEWGIDVVVSGSQKALMTPPGLAFCAVSPRLRERVEAAALPRFYLDWRRAREAQAGGTTAFTPAVSLVSGLVAALDLIDRRGLEAIWEHNRRLARATREGVKALGLALFSPDDDTAAMVSAVEMPDGVDGQRVYATLRDRHGVVLAGGQGPLRGRIMRIGHMGYMDGFDVLIALSALEHGLAEHGFRAGQPGAGVARASAVLGGAP
jgi:aspartate aminotransferase-like enzyme